MGYFCMPYFSPIISSICCTVAKLPWCKKEWPSTKKGLVERDLKLNKMGGQGLLLLIGLKVLVMMTSLQNIVISGAQGLLMLMESEYSKYFP